MTTRWQLDEVTVACSAVADGDMKLPANRAAWLERIGCPRELRICHQVHGAIIHAAGPELVPAVRGDGLVTGDPRWALGVFGADCPGLVLAAPDALGIAHCGWRGQAAGIVTGLVDRLGAMATHPPSTWRGLVGPGICAPCYEVDAAVLDAHPWPPAALHPGRPGHAQLDLTAAIRTELTAAGITTVHTADRCTREHDDLFSYRRAGERAAHLLVAWRGN